MPPSKCKRDNFNWLRGSSAIAVFAHQSSWRVCLIPNYWENRGFQALLAKLGADEVYRFYPTRIALGLEKIGAWFNVGRSPTRLSVVSHQL